MHSDANKLAISEYTEFGIGNKHVNSSGQITSGFNKADLKAETAAVFTPVVRFFLLLIAYYYAINTVANFNTLSGQTQINFASLSSFSCIAAAMCYCTLRNENSLLKLEIAGIVGNGLLLINILNYFSYTYDPSRLVYFILLVFIFPLTGATWRVSVFFSAAAFACLYTTILANNPADLHDYVFIGIASCFVAFGGSSMLRRIIFDALNAKLVAAQHKSDAEKAAEEATKLAITDTLTGLPNRRAFFNLINADAAKYSGDGKTMAVFLIDLDDFKPVNDTYGHSVGDNLLVEVSQRLPESMPEGTYIARIGGDEFAAITSVSSKEEALEAGNHLCQAMRAPFNLGRIVVHVGATVGVALKENQQIKETNLVEYADYALYNAKRRSKGSCSIFTPSDAAVMTRLFFVDQALRRSNLEQELTVVYQPQFDIIENRVTGFEALARWRSAELGTVDPATFISVAESTGMITKVTLTLLRKAMIAFQSWPEDVNLAFNLSVHDILDVAAIDEILKIVAEAGVSPSRICFEITETVMMGDVEKASIALQKIVDAGHDVALDDFGTGYSNFNYLNKLPLSKIKIDRSFVRDVAQGGQSFQTISALLQLTRSLNKECVVEGVETEAEYAAMKGLGARIIQGYYFGRPMVDQDVKMLFEKADEADVKNILQFHG